ncbi:hypothetical protein IMAU80627_00486 [Lactobacillus helveticus]|uniref:site-specific DNA-methyltransferase n=1 Tax=Lactobacillus helveticus TaxID=1587 RepID=UPI0003368ECB|nr:site-specific DNA-methyltransferase [Lactobacillus helveticus]NRN71956.1 hypothetical protein [Lactobacillus helveticus]CDA27937.1 dNA methylase [Lactobacillus amylovorus CAG:719]
MQTDNEKYNETVQPNTAFLNELKEKLPEFFTREGSFNLDKFRNQLKDKNINELSEGYQLDFIGKDYARRQAGEMPSTVIVPDEKQNQGEGKNSKNLFFTGDNLEVLRHLQNNYQNKIDVIYIDPPYNTGSDGFVYPDSFEYSDDKLKDMFELNDDQVERVKSIQGKSSHSAWLTFMYPRLAMAKKLLAKDGVIFISIDDNEMADLKIMMDELYGEKQLIGNIAWESKTKSQNTATSYDKLQPKVEYILAYSKYGHSHFHLNIKGRKKYPFHDEKGAYRNYTLETMASDGVRGRTSMIFPIKGIVPPSGQQWKLGKEKIQMYDLRKDIELKNEKIILKIRPNDENSLKTEPFWAFYPKDIGTAESGKKILNQLMGVRETFDTVKPTGLIKSLLFHSSQKNSIVMDFFAGSSTTADAVMQLNTEDGGHRKFIMVQLPEKTYYINKDGREVPTKGGKAAYDAGFKSIDEISRERIRRAAKKIREDNELTLPEDFDGSFKHYRVVKPVKQTLEEIDDFDPNNTNLFTNMVDGFSSHALAVDGDATGEETILATWLAKDGYSFDADVEEIKFSNYTAYKVEDNRLYLINEGWRAEQTKELLNKLGTYQLEIQSVVLFGYSFNVAELRELENGLKQLDSKVTLIKRY